MNPCRRRISGLVLFSFLSCQFLAGAGPTPSPQLTQDAYVWNRAWTPPVQRSVEAHSGAFKTLIPLAAEVSWKKTAPQVVRIPLNTPVLKKVGRPIGLALRAGPWPGPFETNQPPCKLLMGLAQSIIEEARAANLQVSELQLDFDCAQARLAGYRKWVEALRNAIAPVPLVITALPSWLDEPEFAKLASAADGFVLQVHSLERPRGFNAPFTLCDPAAARRAVKRAGQLQIPFRVALPSYGYDIAFDAADKFIGLAAEGTLKPWPKNARVREVMSDPVQIAGLVQEWSTNRPPAMKGIAWYRLPVDNDILCWRWQTLSAIIALRLPRESFRAEARRVEAGLVEISLINEGDLDISSRLTLETRWSRDGGIRLLAGDGLRGFEKVDAGTSTASFQTKAGPCHLRAGDKLVVGWLRFSKDREVQVEVRRIKPEGGAANRPEK